MNHTEQLTRYTAQFIDELVQSGMKQVVISPGSRSTPLAVLAEHHPEIKVWILVDERSAAYFALGIAKATEKPVALICTSGTAAANYYPAVVEASMDRIPLLLVTADRPHELRGIGAPQAINQVQLYGDYVKDFLELALPEASPKMLRYVRQRASRVVRIATQNIPGPVHVNMPFREPLMPNIHLDYLWGHRDTAYNPSMIGKAQLPTQNLEELVNIMTSHKKGLIVCGPQVDASLPNELVTLAETLGIPVLADPLSQVRTGEHAKQHVIATYDALFRDKTIRAALKPDYIIRFGAMPISKSYRFFVEDHQDVIQFVVEHGEMVREPTNHHSHYIFADSVHLCTSLNAAISQPPMDKDWLQQWKHVDQATQKLLQQSNGATLNEGEAVREICASMPGNGVLLAGNSMPIRDLDTFLIPMNQPFQTYGNRGASGIDGVTSTALGIAAVSDKQVTLIIGDLSFYHDLNGLLAAKQYGISLRVILLNNNGGGIFSFLPQAKDPTYFETLFGTPLDLDFEKVVTMYGGSFTRVLSKEDLSGALRNSSEKAGLQVVEIVTNREQNTLWHKQLWSNISKEVMSII